MKLRLLKRFNRKNPGDIVEIAKESEARVMKAVGIAEDYVEGRRGKTSTRDMRPEQQPEPAPAPVPVQPEQSTQTSHPVPAMSTEENKDAPAVPPTQQDTQQDGGNGDFGSDRYSRRDMQPKE